MFSTLLGAKVGAALAAGAVGFGALGAAAYAGVLPSGLQDIAHASIGAPSAEEAKSADATKDATKDATDATRPTAVGPDATGRAAFGLCTAWEHAKAQGQVADKSVAFRNLATAAGGVDKIVTYCATVPHPGATATGNPTTHPTGKPATIHPTGKSATTHPAVKPSSHPTGKPATHPAGNPGRTP